jgi:FtsH-binding integral membrane protein
LGSALPLPRTFELHHKEDKIMLDTRIILSGTWITVMLIYFLGDVLRIYSGDAARMEAAQPSASIKWLGAAIIMLIPIAMVFLSLVLPQPISRWLNIIVAIGFILFVAVDLGSYPSAYDKFLLIVSLAFKAAVVWYAWNWL